VVRGRAPRTTKIAPPASCRGPLATSRRLAAHHAGGPATRGGLAGATEGAPDIAEGSPRIMVTPPRTMGTSPRTMGTPPWCEGGGLARRGLPHRRGARGASRHRGRGPSHPRGLPRHHAGGRVVRGGGTRRPEGSAHREEGTVQRGGPGAVRGRGAVVRGEPPAERGRDAMARTTGTVGRRTGTGNHSPCGGTRRMRCADRPIRAPSANPATTLERLGRLTSSNPVVYRR
jgi:hypothetical protein